MEVHRKKPETIPSTTVKSGKLKFWITPCHYDNIEKYYREYYVINNKARSDSCRYVDGLWMITAGYGLFNSPKMEQYRDIILSIEKLINNLIIVDNFDLDLDVKQPLKFLLLKNDYFCLI